MTAVLLLSMGMSMVSCNDSEATPQETNMPPDCFIEFQRISSATGYSMDDGELWLLKHESGVFDERSRSMHPEYYDSVRRSVGHQPIAYGNMRIVVHAETSMEQQTWSEEELRHIGEYTALKQQNAAKMSLPGEVESRMNKERAAQGQDLVLVGYFFNAYITGNAVVTADKRLFGLEPGEDLSSHFLVQGPSTCLPKGSMTDFTYLFWHEDEVQARTTAEFFVPGTWLQQNYAFWLADMPGEEYDEVTFTISLPVARDNWLRYFIKTASDQGDAERTTLTATATVHFGLPSDFEQQYKLHAQWQPLWMF